MLVRSKLGPRFNSDFLICYTTVTSSRADCKWQGLTMNAPQVQLRVLDEVGDI
jgi:hypothetical protein